MSLAIALLVPWLLGYLVVQHLVQPLSARAERVLMTFLAIGVGFGATSMIAYVLLVSGRFEREVQLIVETALIVLLGAAAWRRRANLALPPLQPGAEENSPGLRKGLLALLCVVTIICLGVFAVVSRLNPHGGWDGWAIWNLRARFLYHGAAHWTDAFSSSLLWSHPDYPLLIPASIARGWLIAGMETVAVPILFAGLLTFGSAGLLVAGLWATRSPSQGCVGGAVLLATPFFITHGASQYADGPLAFYFLAFVVAWSLCERAPSVGRYLLLGFLAGLSAWVKNEGLLFMLLATAGAGAILARHGGRAKWREIAAIFCGVLPVVVLLLHFKTQLAPAGDLFPSQPLAALFAKLTDVGRHGLIFKSLLSGTVSFGAWPLSFPLALVVYSSLVGRRPGAWSNRFEILPLAIFGFMLAGYYLIFAVTPYDLDWHLRFSTDRLLLQLWPSVLFVYFSILRTPEEMMSTEKK